MQQSWLITAGVALAVACLAFFLGRTTAQESDPAPVETSVDELAPVVDEDDTVEVATQPEPDAAPILSDPVARESHLRRELEKEQRRVAELKAELAARDAAAKATPEVARPEGSAPYVYPGAEKIVEGLDVESAGKALATMSPLIGEFMKGFAAGKPDMKLQGKIQQHNAVLIGQALKVQGSGTSGHGVNGAFTHPAVQVNYIHATLRAAELPLSETQETRLKEIGDRFVKDEARRVAGYNERTFALQKLIDEGALKDRFFAEVDELLTAEQRAVLHPEGTAGRLRADLFSSGLVWGTVAGALPYSDRETLATAMAARAYSHLQLGTENEALVTELAQDYAIGFPDAYIRHKANGFDKAGIFHISRVRTAAAQQLKFLQALADRLPMDGEARKRIVGTAFVLVPITP